MIAFNALILSEIVFKNWISTLIVKKLYPIYRNDMIDRSNGLMPFLKLKRIKKYMRMPLAVILMKPNFRGNMRNNFLYMR